MFRVKWIFPLAFFLGLACSICSLAGCAVSPLKEGAYVPVIELPPIEPASENLESEVIKYANIPTLDQWVAKYEKEGWVIIGGAA